MAPPPLARRRAGAVRGLVLLLVGGLALGGVGSWLARRAPEPPPVPPREHCEVTPAADLDLEQAGNAALIAGIAVRRRLPARAATIALATAIQESKLYNLEYGDRDSLGLFQQRPSQGWGTAAQIRDPVYATNKFYDALVKVPGYQNLPITEAAQRVQRSAYPEAYGYHEAAARALASALQGYDPGQFGCIALPPTGLGAEAVGERGLTARARAVADAAKRELGVTGVAASPDGTIVRFTTTGAEARRTAWAVAHWAVARTEGLTVTAVGVADRRWRRSDLSIGWAASSSPSGSGSSATGSSATGSGATGSGAAPAAGALAAGVVEVTVAAGGSGPSASSPAGSSP